MLKALVLIITASLAAKTSGEDWTCHWRAAKMSTKEAVRFLQRCTSGGRQQQRENMLLSHPAHHDPPYLFSPWPCPFPAVTPGKHFFPWLFTSKHIPLHRILRFLVFFSISLVFNQYFPLNFSPPCFVSSCLITPLFFAASSPVLHLSPRESSYLRDIKGRSAFLSHCSSQARGSSRLDQVPSREDPLSRTTLYLAQRVWISTRTHEESCHMMGCIDKMWGTYIYIPGGK